MGNANRRKGHNLEREIVRIFRDIFGFKFCRTSRSSSRILDDSKIDIDNIPFNIQCKSGYDRSPPKYVVIYNDITEALKKNYPEDNPRHRFPVVLIHKDSSRKSQGYTWTLRHEDMVDLLTDYYNTKNQLDEVLNSIK